MPTYDFICEDCGHEFEAIMSMSAHAKGRPACPQCKSKNTAQLITTFTAITSRKS